MDNLDTQAADIVNTIRHDRRARRLRAGSLSRSPRAAARRARYDRLIQIPGYSDYLAARARAAYAKKNALIERALREL